MLPRPIPAETQPQRDYFCLIEDEQLFLVADEWGATPVAKWPRRWPQTPSASSSPVPRTTTPLALQDGPAPVVSGEPPGGGHQACQQKESTKPPPVTLRMTGMGTTVVIGQICEDKFYIAHVGDSRCYRVRDARGGTDDRDHSLLEDYKDARPGMTEVSKRNSRTET